MSIPLHPNGRGYYQGEFRDAIGNNCSIQESCVPQSLWIGIQHPNPRRPIPNGWEPVVFPTNVIAKDVFGQPIGHATDTIFDTKAHLNRKHAQKILDIFQEYQDNKLITKHAFTDTHGVTITAYQDGEFLVIGPAQANPRTCTKGWQPVPYPPDTIFTTHMLLTHQQIQDLTPLLQHFIQTGQLPNG